ncbi:TPA: hypothetical protein I9085_002484 [Clostridium perfringens]|nr:hypothetical protein [Clostridium perfringens]
MKNKKYKQLEKRVTALENKIQEQQETIEKLISMNFSNRIKIKHPSLSNGTMFC